MFRSSITACVLILSSAALAVPGVSQETSYSPGTPKEESVQFSVRNGSFLPRKIEIAGNILDFGPFEVRYVGFPSGTKAYVYDADAPAGRGKLLFTVSEDLRNERLSL